MDRTEHILVAEDDPADAFFLQRAFKRAGIVVCLHFVQDGQEAIAYLKGCGGYSVRSVHPLPDLLLLDLKMPRLNGFEVLDWIRKQAQLKSLAVVIFTSSEEAGDIHRAYALGANAYLIKPHSIQDLSDLVGNLKKHWSSLGVSALTGGTELHPFESR